MPRKPRFNLPDAPQHIIQCGSNQGPCFLAEEDNRRYLDDLTDAASKNIVVYMPMCICWRRR